MKSRPSISPWKVRGWRLTPRRAMPISASIRVATRISAATLDDTRNPTVDDLQSHRWSARRGLAPFCFIRLTIRGDVRGQVGEVRALTPRWRSAFPWFESTGNQGSLPTVDRLFVTDLLPLPSVDVPLTGRQGLLPRIGDEHFQDRPIHAVTAPTPLSRMPPVLPEPCVPRGDVSLQGGDDIRTQARHRVEQRRV